MKKTVKTLLIVLFVLVSAISCVKDDPDGKWTKMKWQVPSSLVQVQEGIYQIPTSGGSFTLICENYKPWISSLTEIGSHVSKEYPGPCDSLQGEWCSVKCENNNVSITFSPLADDDVLNLRSHSQQETSSTRLDSCSSIASNRHRKQVISANNQIIHRNFSANNQFNQRI